MAILKLILLAILLMAFVVAGLAVKLLFKKNGEFPNTHIGGNEYLKKQGITCAQTFDKAEQAKVRKELIFKSVASDDSETKSYF